MTEPSGFAGVGTALPPLSLPPLSRTTIALYAAGSGDFVPLHIDQDFARQAGYPDVFMHGMLGMAYLARLVTGWVPQAQVREVGVRFVSITYPGEVLTATGRVSAVDVDGVPGRVSLDLRLLNAEGSPKLRGRAVVDLSD
ncbi:MAG: hypothetical protein KF785_10945 [Gemmatimonadales bacterium]|nr:hypothetical protein [Gemmatimonadales bacterium]